MHAANSPYENKKLTSLGTHSNSIAVFVCSPLRQNASKRTYTAVSRSTPPSLPLAPQLSVLKSTGTALIQVTRSQRYILTKTNGCYSTFILLDHLATSNTRSGYLLPSRPTLRFSSSTTGQITYLFLSSYLRPWEILSDPPSKHTLGLGK